MKRTLSGLGLILLFVLAVVLTDLCFMTRYAGGMNKKLDLIEKAQNVEELKSAAKDLDDFFDDYEFWAHRFVPTERLDELETLLHKLNAYILTEDIHEISATTAEIRSRVNLLYSTDFYHWYHPIEFSIE